MEPLACFRVNAEVERLLEAGRGDEALRSLERELSRSENSEDAAGYRFLFSQIIVCQARMGRKDEARRLLEDFAEKLSPSPENALLLSEGYLDHLRDPERAVHHAALALLRVEDTSAYSDEFLARVHSQLARTLLAAGDIHGAHGAWSEAPLPDPRIAMELIEAGFDRNEIKITLEESLFLLSDRSGTSSAESTTVDRIRRLIAWIEAEEMPKQP